MNTWIIGYVSRLVIGSFFLFAVQAMAGKGSHAEPLRMACACVMILLVLTPLIGDQWSLARMMAAMDAAEAEIRDTAATAQADMENELRDAVDAELTAILQKNGYICSVMLDYEEQMPVRAEVSAWQGDREAIQTAVCAYTGLLPEQICFPEEEKRE